MNVTFKSGPPSLPNFTKFLIAPESRPEGTYVPDKLEPAGEGRKTARQGHQDGAEARDQGHSSQLDHDGCERP